MIGDESSIGDDILAGRIEERGLVRRVDFNRTALGSAIFTEIPCAQSDPHYSAVIVPDLDDIIVRVTAKSPLLDLAALVLQPDGQFPRAQGAIWLLWLSTGSMWAERRWLRGTDWMRGSMA